jgi:hypothetical protein
VEGSAGKGPLTSGRKQREEERFSFQGEGDVLEGVKRGAAEGRASLPDPKGTRPVVGPFRLQLMDINVNSHNHSRLFGVVVLVERSRGVVGRTDSAPGVDRDERLGVD